MTDEDLIRQSWALAMVDRDLLARRFYTILFTARPELEGLFRSDIKVQGQKLVETLNFIVDMLDDPGHLMPAARDLAMRHIAYGVQPDFYDDVGGALLAALSDILGDRLTPAMAAAWARAYTALADDMIRTAYGSEEEAEAASNA